MPAGDYWKKYTPEEYRRHCDHMSKTQQALSTEKSLAYYNLSDEEKKEHSEKTKEGISHMTQEERESRNKSAGNSISFTYSLLSEKSKLERNKKISQTKRKDWEELSKQEKEAHGELSRKSQEGMTEEAKKLRSISSSTSRKIYIKNHPTEEKERYRKVSESLKLYLSSLSPEELERRVEPMVKSSKTRSKGSLLWQTIVYDWLESLFPGEFIHNGGQTNSSWIAGLEPDYIHRTLPLIIEYFEAWAHGFSETEEKSKRARYSKEGYRLLVIREEDFFIKESNLQYIKEIKQLLDKLE